MNKPPEEVAARVQPESLRKYVAAIARNAGLTDGDAELLAELLVLNDLRGVFSHGSRQIAGYVPLFLRGELNPRPVLQESARTDTTLVIDGDGGLGYFPAWRAAHQLVEMARASGVAAAITRNHGHIGAAGLYSRVPAAHGFIAYGTSGHALDLRPGQPYAAVAGGSPMTWAIPAGEEHPLVLDFGAMHDFYHPTTLQRIFEMAPGLVFRSVGLGVMCQVLGGILCGVPVTPQQPARRFPGATQGSFLIAVDVGRFMPLDAFRQEIDAYVRLARQLAPLPGESACYLPGGLEASREREYQHQGIPLGPRHLRALAETGARVGVDPPFPVP
ncbi:MAG: Ldh family oxidoreductase [Armatimonadota bacterium]|nr:Ldh family oxidoreductase [Armatimonadota bacterium]